MPRKGRASTPRVGGWDGGDPRLLPSVRRAFAAFLGLSLLGALVAVVLRTGSVPAIGAAAAAATGLGWMGWKRYRQHSVFWCSAVIEATCLLFLVWLAGPLAAAAALFAVVAGRALIERTQDVLAGIALIAVAFAAGLVLDTGFRGWVPVMHVDVLVPTLVGCAVCSAACRLLAAGLSRYEDGNAARYEALVQVSPTLIVVVEPDTTVVFASPAAADVLGIAADALVGQRLVDWVDDVDRERVEASIAGGSGPLDCQLRGADGNPFHAEIAQRDLSDHPVVAGVVLSIRNITERATATDALRHQAYHDALTKLANRALFMDRLQHALQPETPRAAVLLLDLEGFKRINDSLGHEAGDILLAGVAERIRRSASPSDTVARLGGDEFAVLLVDDRATDGTALDVAVRIGTAFSEAVDLGEQRTIAQGSMGIAVATPGLSPSALLRNADVAMYQAKAAGKNRVEIFHPEMDREAGRRRAAELELRHAAATGQWIAHYQPIVDLASGRVQAVEALVRWNHPERGLLAPEAFLPMAEETGLVLELGRWMLHEACHRVADWQRRSLGGGTLGLTVNVSVRELRDRGFVAHVSEALESSGLEPNTLTLDITEEALNETEEAVHSQLHQLRRLGVRVAIDDFGTGSSSLRSLPQFPIDALKIDRSFVSQLTWPQPEAPALTRTIIAMGQALGVSVVAEGVETTEQHAELVGMGCATGQGFVIARPMSPPALEQLLMQPVLAS